MCALSFKNFIVKQPIQGFNMTIEIYKQIGKIYVTGALFHLAFWHFYFIKIVLHFISSNFEISANKVPSVFIWGSMGKVMFILWFWHFGFNSLVLIFTRSNINLNGSPNEKSKALFSHLLTCFKSAFCFFGVEIKKIRNFWVL